MRPRPWLVTSLAGMIQFDLPQRLMQPLYRRHYFPAMFGLLTHDPFKVH